MSCGIRVGASPKDADAGPKLLVSRAMSIARGKCVREVGGTAKTSDLTLGRC
jgi:hypothetical protein